MYLECFQELFLTVAILMSNFEHKNCLRTIEAQIVQKLKNNEARPKFTGSYEKKRVVSKKNHIVHVCTICEILYTLQLAYL